MVSSYKLALCPPPQASSVSRVFSAAVSSSTRALLVPFSHVAVVARLAALLCHTMFFSLRVYFVSVVRREALRSLRRIGRVRPCSVLHCQTDYSTRGEPIHHPNARAVARAASCWESLAFHALHAVHGDRDFVPAPQRPRTASKQQESSTRSLTLSRSVVVE